MTWHTAVDAGKIEIVVSPEEESLALESLHGRSLFKFAQIIQGFVQRYYLVICITPDIYVIVRSELILACVSGCTRIEFDVITEHIRKGQKVPARVSRFLHTIINAYDKASCTVFVLHVFLRKSVFGLYIKERIACAKAESQKQYN